MPKFLYITWEDFHQACFELAKKIIQKDIQFDRIIAISRGGLVVGRILSDFLDLPISPFTIVTYTSINKKGVPKIKEGLRAKIKGERLLLVDEVSDSGGTFRTGLKYLKTFKPKSIATLAPYIKSWTNFIPDYWYQKTSKWIIYPYEIKKTVTEIKKNNLQINLIKLGLPKNQVSFFIK